MPQSDFSSPKDSPLESATSAPSAPIDLDPHHNLLCGHQNAQAQLYKALISQTCPHAWLLQGIRGIGKATLAHRAVRFLLSDAHDKSADRLKGEKERGEKESLAIKDSHPIWALIKARSHPDFLLITPSQEKKTQIIAVDDIRKVNDFLTRSPALGRYRVCMIDAVDNMNHNAANALLKSLEDAPPNSFFFLISHQPSLVLRTISSRCRLLKMKPLDKPAIEQILSFFMPKLKAEQKNLAVKLGYGSARLSLAFAQTRGRKLYNDFQNLTRDLTHFDNIAIHNFCHYIAQDKDGELYQLFCALMTQWVYHIATKTKNPQIRAKSFDLWDDFNQMISQQARFHLDRKQAAQNMFLKFEDMVR